MSSGRTSDRRTGSHRAAQLGALLAPCLPTLVGYLHNLTRDRATAEEVLQDSIVRALRGLDGFTPGTNFRAWILRIATNTFLSRRKYEVLRASSSLEDVEPIAAREEAAGGDFDAHDPRQLRALYVEAVESDLRRALDDLPEVFRVALLLSALGGLTHEEIATALEVPPGTVMSRLHRARQRVRRVLSDRRGVERRQNEEA